MYLMWLSRHSFPVHEPASAKIMPHDHVKDMDAFELDQVKSSQETFIRHV